MVPKVGQRIGPYEILGRLGSGGMGLVFSAWDSRLHRDVAIKLLREEYLTPIMRSRFMAEARAASRLNHPNICTIFDIGEHEGYPYMVMELLKGETLRDRLQQGASSVEDVLAVARDVADALAVAHSHGIVHRDIKPANIVLVGKPGGRFQTKVLDFGLAKIDLGEGIDPLSGLTSVGMTVGTVSYMSPEQARGELLDKRSDLFSLGVVLYEMITGTLPFNGATSALVFVHLLNDPPQPIRELNTSVPRSVDQIITFCMQKDRNARFQSAEEMLEALQKLSLNATSEEKQSWLNRLTSGWKQSGPSSAVREEPFFDAYPEDNTPTPKRISGASLIRPVKRVSSNGNPGAQATSVNREEGTDSHSEPSPFQPAEDIRGVSTGTAQLSSGWSTPVSSVSIPLVSPDESISAPATLENLAALEDEQAAASVLPVDGPELFQEQKIASKWRIVIGSVLVAGAIAASVALFYAKHPSSTSGTPATVWIGPVANRTGDSNLDGVVSAGLELVFQQSPHLALLSAGEAVDVETASSVPQAQGIQRAAQRAEAKTFIAGDIRSEGAAYAITLQLLDTKSGKKIATWSKNGVSREGVVGAIDTLAASVRSALHESRESMQTTSVPLRNQATGNLEAIKFFASGEQLEANGHLFDAMYAFERAAALEPNFPQAHLRLAELFQMQHAEVSAANAALQAQTTAAKSDDRTRVLSQAIYALEAEGDYSKAATLLEDLRQRYPFDTGVLCALSRAQRLQGDFAGALQSARTVLRFAPQSKGALEATQLALIALNHVAEAAQLAPHAAGQSNSYSAAAVLLSFLHADSSVTQPETEISADDLAGQGNLAAVLDANGQLHEGLARWRDIATKASAAPELLSSASYVFGQAALNRALMSDCSQSLSLVQEASNLPAGPTAIFALGMASGMCGDLNYARKSIETLNTNYAQSFAVRTFLVSDLNAVVLWKSGLIPDAVVTLESAKDYDAISLTAYVRGLVDMANNQPQLANVEFQTILKHRGEATLVNPVVYTMAQAGVARSYAASTDALNASQAYQNLLAALPHADPDSSLMVEARTSAQ